MKNLLFTTFILLCFIQQFTDALFFGPVAVGLGLGILALKKGFLIGTAVANSRTRRSYQRSSYRYQPQHHYNTGYNRWYTKPRKYYYYSSKPYSSYSYRGKRDTEHPDLLELKRIKREVEQGDFNINNWYRDITEMDQDGCGKKLICELRAKEKSIVGFTEDERLIAENFGSGNQVDVSDITVEYDLAAQMGKYMGLERCQQMYNRCDLSSEDMVKMITTEMDNLDRMKRDLDEEEVDVDRFEREEEEETLKEFENIPSDDGNDWVWT